MIKIDWYDNDGCANPAPNTLNTAKCGVCGTEMNVERGVLGATSYAEALSGSKHKYDRFRCPRLNESWHQRIYQLKMWVYLAEMRKAADYKEKKRAAKKEILCILKKHKMR